MSNAAENSVRILMVGDAGNQHSVLGDVFARHAVTSRARRYELALFLAQVQSQSPR